MNHYDLCVRVRRAQGRVVILAVATVAQLGQNHAHAGQPPRGSVRSGLRSRVLAQACSVVGRHIGLFVQRSGAASAWLRATGRDVGRSNGLSVGTFCSDPIRGNIWSGKALQA